VQFELALPVVCVSTLVEPSVFGIFRPVLLLPEGIFSRLTPAQVEAVIGHVRHRDHPL
jgi:beta-lactamase regulating signal transducer with metallopeptidase domain